MRQTPAGVGDTSMFDDALCLFPTTMSVAEYNVANLHVNGQPVAGIKAVHSGPSASKSSADGVPNAWSTNDADCNIWVQAGLVNEAVGTVVAISCNESGGSPPYFPQAVTVWFDSYTGPTLSDGTVPITPIRCTWLSTYKQYSRLQLVRNQIFLLLRLEITTAALNLLLWSILKNLTMDLLNHPNFPQIHPNWMVVTVIYS